MSLVLADRVRETTQTTGTGTITLDGAVQGFQSFAVIGNNNTTYYTINRGAEWEVGIGTYYGGTLSRDTVYASSNGNSKVNFSAGSKDVFVTYPASKSVNEDANNRVLIPYTSGTTNVGSLNVGNATGHTDSGVIAGFTASEPLYLYTSLQNTSASNTSYASYAVNDGGHTAYGELGINNANYSYSAAGFPNNGFSLPLASFVESFGGPLVLGSWDSQKISFIVNGAVNTADAMTIETTGAVTIPTAAVTGGAINGTTVGATTPAAGKFTTLESTGIASLGTGSTTYVRAIGDASYPGIYVTGGTNTPLVLQPLGTGALQAQKTDSTATGGNARGANAVDWQTSRNAANQIASNSNAVIAGGNANLCSGFAGSIVGGSSNISNNNYTFVGGGLSNTASSPYAIITGGYSNTSAGYLNFIGGGFTNSGTSSSAVTTQSGTMNATTAVTLSGSNANIKVGQLVTGTSINSFPNTYVAAISGTSLTLSQAASGSSTSTLSFFTPHGVVVGGGNNQATGSYSFIGGGGDAGTAGNRNVASGDWSTVAGGMKNTASANHSSIAGGYGNTASGFGAFVGGGGLYGDFGTGATAPNTASGVSSAVLGGWNNSATSNGAAVLGGVESQATGFYSAVVGGSYGTTRGVIGNTVFPASNAPLAVRGTAQSGLLILGKQTTDATPTVLVCNQSAASTTNQVILPNNSAYYFRGTVVAGVTGGGNTKGWTVEGVIKRGAGVGTTAIVGTATVTSSYADAGASTWAITATADTTNGGLAITFTGQAATTIRCVAKIETTEMTY
jgi:hypothetical protein